MLGSLSPRHEPVVPMFKVECDSTTWLSRCPNPRLVCVCHFKRSFVNEHSDGDQFVDWFGLQGQRSHLESSRHLWGGKRSFLQNSKIKMAQKYICSVDNC